MTDTFHHLAPKERAKRYRELAEEAEQSGLKSRGDTREAYRLMAEQWRKLAEEVEATSK